MVVNKRIMSFIGGGLLAVTCVLYIVSNALPMWSKLHIDSNLIATTVQQMSASDLQALGLTAEMVADLKSITTTYGLWQICVSVDQITSNSISTCLNLPSEGLPSDVSAKMLSARAFISIACILSAVATACVVGRAFVKEDSSGILIRLAKVLPFVTLVSGIIGVAVGISHAIPISLLRISVAAILGIIALVFNLASAIVVLLIK